MAQYMCTRFLHNWKLFFVSVCFFLVFLKGTLKYLFLSYSRLTDYWFNCLYYLGSLFHVYVVLLIALLYIIQIFVFGKKSEKNEKCEKFTRVPLREKNYLIIHIHTYTYYTYYIHTFTIHNTEQPNISTSLLFHLT